MCDPTQCDKPAPFRLFTNATSFSWGDHWYTVANVSNSLNQSCIVVVPSTTSSPLNKYIDALCCAIFFCVLLLRVAGSCSSSVDLDEYSSLYSDSCSCSRFVSCRRLRSITCHRHGPSPVVTHGLFRTSPNNSVNSPTHAPNICTFPVRGFLSPQSFLTSLELRPRVYSMKQFICWLSLQASLFATLFCLCAQIAHNRSCYPTAATKCYRDNSFLSLDVVFKTHSVYIASFLVIHSNMNKHQQTYPIGQLNTYVYWSIYI